MRRERVIENNWGNLTLSQQLRIWMIVMRARYRWEARHYLIMLLTFVLILEVGHSVPMSMIAVGSIHTGVIILRHIEYRRYKSKPQE